MHTTLRQIVAIIAYLVLAAACFYSVEKANDANESSLKRAKTARVELADSARKAVSVSCQADKANAIVLRRAVRGQQQFIRSNPAPPPPTTRKRIAALQVILEQIEVPDCAARVKLISKER